MAADPTATTALHPPGLERRAFQLLMALTAVTALIYVYSAFFVPGTLTYAPFTIQDDARQFLTGLQPGGGDEANLLAAYWHDVSPLAYRLLYGAAGLIGLPPTVFARLLPVVLLFLSAWLAWRVARRLTGERPIAAFVAAAFLVSFLLHEDSIASATPRAFSAPLFLWFIDGLQRERGVAMIPALFLLGLVYPTTALVGVTMLGLSRIGIRPWRIDLSRRSWLLGGVAALAVLLAILPFAGAESAWGPTQSIQDALEQPSTGTFEGRSSIVGRDGRVDYLCSARMGLLTEIVPCWSTSLAVVPNLLLMIPLFVLAWRAVRRRRYAPGGEPGELLYAWVVIAGIAWWAVATLVAFKLHLPSRYTQRTLALFEFLAIGQLLGAQLERARSGRRRGLTRNAPGLLLGLFFTASFLSPTPGLQRPRDTDAVQRLADMPDGTTVGGVSEDLDFYPALTGQPVLATIEHAIPYSTRYFSQLQQRLEASLTAIATPDPAVLAAYVQRYHVGVIALDAAYLEYRELPARWASVVPHAVQVAQGMLDNGPSIVQQRAGACTLHRGAVVLLDARCLVAPPASPPLATPAHAPI